MEELSLIDFLKFEVQYLRELLAAFVAEEYAYKNNCLETALHITAFQKQILHELKLKRPQKFKYFDLNNDIEGSLLQSLKDQIELLLTKLHFQQEKTQFSKNLVPEAFKLALAKPKILTQTEEDLEC